MVTNKKKNPFKDKVSKNVERQKMVGVPDYLNIPKGIKLYKETPGATDVKLDILPYYVTDENHPDRDNELRIAIPGTQWYMRRFLRHINVGVNNKKILCPRAYGKDCPICEHRNKRAEEGASDKELNTLNAKKRVLYSVVPLNDENYEKIPHIWDISFHNFQSLLNEELEIDEERGIFPDPKEGYTLVVRFSKESWGQFTYADASRIDFIERDKHYTEEELKQVPKLDESLILKSYEEIFAEFWGKPISNGEDESEEEDESQIDEVELKEPQQEGEVFKRRRRRRKPKAENKENCPHELIFGKDWDTDDVCEDCNLFSECQEEYEEKWETEEDE